MTLSLSSSMDKRIFRNFLRCHKTWETFFPPSLFLLWWQKNLSKYLVKSPRTSLKMIFFRIKSLLRSNSQILISSSRGCPNTHLVLTHFFFIFAFNGEERKISWLLVRIKVDWPVDDTKTTTLNFKMCIKILCRSEFFGYRPRALTSSLSSASTIFCSPLEHTTVEEEKMSTLSLILFVKWWIVVTCREHKLQSLLPFFRNTRPST